MKKIILLLFMLIFCAQLCFAQEEQAPQNIQAEQTSQATQPEQALEAEPEESYEEITSYFDTDEPTATSEPTVYEGHVEYTQYQLDAEGNTIELENTRLHALNLSKPQKISAKSLSKKPTFYPIQDELKSASMFSTPEYNIKSVSTSYSQNLGKFSFGTMYDSGLSKASRNDSTALFAKYEWKYAAMSLGFSKSTNCNKNSYEDEFFFAPELKLTKRLSLLDVLETDVSQINKSNELVLRYTPSFKNHEDDVQFELGAGQSFYEDNFIKSTVRFSTKFKL